MTDDHPERDGDDGAYRAAFPELATMLDGIHRRTRFCRRCRAPRDLHPLCAVCGQVVCAVDDDGCCPSCAEGRRRYARRGYQVGSGLIGSRTPAQATR